MDRGYDFFSTSTYQEASHFSGIIAFISFITQIGAQMFTLSSFLNYISSKEITRSPKELQHGSLQNIVVFLRASDKTNYQPAVRSQIASVKPSIL